jgi:tRNA modification GTPase
MSRSQYLSTDTIHALATPVGGALSIVRMSGPRAVEILRALEPETDVRERSPRVIFRSKLRSPDGKLVDDAMSVIFLAPATQTGEDLVELYLHGGATVAERVLAALAALGSSVARAVEVPCRGVRDV